MSLCGLCAIRSYALVNGKRISAKKVGECVEKIKEKIEEELAIHQ
ncbi:DUF1450 domain-containing protein [Bacillaceae bacterium S4-13-58]